MTTIYALHDPTDRSGRVYVGKTAKRLHQRILEHTNAAKRGELSPRARWIKSILERGMMPAAVVLEEVLDGGDWEEAERFWIASLRTLGLPLLNLTDGGEGLLGHRRSEVTRRKIGDAQRGRKYSPERCQHIGDALRGKPLSRECKRKISDALRGRKASAETLKKRSEARRGKALLSLRGKKFSLDHCLKIADARRRWWAAQRLIKANADGRQLSLVFTGRTS
jgi:group I intron endonuclease